MNLRQEKGITLIALVITIIVMLILVGVTITIAVNGGLFDYAKYAATETNKAKEYELGLADVKANLTYQGLIDKYTTGTQTTGTADPAITTTEEGITITNLSATDKAHYKELFEDYVKQEAASAGFSLESYSLDEDDYTLNYAFKDISISPESSCVAITVNVSSIAEDGNWVNTYYYDETHGWQAVIMGMNLTVENGTINTSWAANMSGPFVFIVTSPVPDNPVSPVSPDPEPSSY